MHKLIKYNKEAIANICKDHHVRTSHMIGSATRNKMNVNKEEDIPDSK